MARRRQRILLRRRMHQCIDIVPYWREKTHRPCTHVLPKQTRPYFAANVRSEPIKRTLRRAAREAQSAAASALEAPSRGYLPGMVKFRLP